MKDFVRSSRRQLMTLAVAIFAAACSSEPPAGVGDAQTPPAGCRSSAECTTPGPCARADGARCEEGVCHYSQLEQGSVCDDGDPCTAKDQCTATGACAGEAACRPPTASAPGPVEAAEDSSVEVTLTGTDPEDAAERLQVAIASQPAHGTLSATSGPAPLAVTYTPNPDFFGQDSFAFTVTDPGGRASAPQAVSVTVTPVDDAPVAQPVTLTTTTEDVAVELTLTGTDADAAEPLTVAVVVPPGHGTLTALSGTAPLTVRYQPAADFHGDDSFAFTLTDPSGLVSALTTVSLRVTAVNDPPVAQAPLGLTTAEDAASAMFVLTGTDVDDAELEVVVQAGPAHGTLSARTGTAPLAVRYTPEPDFAGEDVFALVVRDPHGGASAPVPVTVQVTAVADPPRATGLATMTLDEDQPRGLVLSGTDPDGAGPLAITVTALPAHGTLSPATGTAPLSVVYSPAPDFHGDDSLTYVLTDATGLESAPHTMALRVLPVNDPPQATPVGPATIDEDTGLSLTLTGTDVDGLAGLRVEVTAGPAHGTLDVTSGAAPLAVRYTPAPNFHGGDSVTFRVVDVAAAASATVTVQLTVRPINDPPVAQPAQLTVRSGYAAGQVPATDVDGDPLTYELVTAPVDGTATLNASTGELYYQVTRRSCVDSLSFRVTDGTLYSAPARIELLGTAPHITAMKPSSGPAGIPVRLEGCNFSSSTGTVRFSSGYGASIVSWTDRAVVINAPGAQEAQTYDVVLSGSGGDTTPVPFELLPSIHSVNPRFAAGQNSVLGSALGTAQGTVTVDGVAAQVQSWGSTLVNFTPPASTPPGERSVVVTTAKGVATNRSTIIVRGKDSWSVSAEAPPIRGALAAVWTGRAAVVWGGTSRAGGRFLPAYNTWLPIASAGSPTDANPLGPPTAVWTGQQVLIWGGTTNVGNGYDPHTDTWTPMTSTGAPAARHGHTAVWTGSEMIVWGGVVAGTESATGGRYDPATKQWRTISASGAPQARQGHVAVWTGTEMIIWGGATAGGSALATGARYDPATDRWTPMAMANAPSARILATAVWTGEEMLVWGGGSSASLPTNTGGRYDPVADAWSAISTTGAPGARVEHTALWTGAEMIVWGGKGTSAIGARYSPATGTWRAMSSTDAPAPRRLHAAVWTGAEMVVWGGQLDSGVFSASGARYEPVADRWVTASQGAAPELRNSPSVVFGSGEAMFWGGEAVGGARVATGGRYIPYFDRWSPLSPVGAPAARSGATAIWSGTQMLLWGGTDGTSLLASGGRYTLAGNAWSPMSTAGAPPGRKGHSAVWADSAMFVWGGVDDAGAPTRSGARYDPVTDAWSALNQTGAPSARSDAMAVWLNAQVILWGGRDGAGERNDGARYQPSTDSWLSLSATGAPSARAAPLTVVAGSEVVVWGGLQGTTALRSGARYNPWSNTWTAIADAPFAAQGAVGGAYYVSGSGWQVLVWGGTGNSGPNSGGAVLNVSTNTWTPISAAGAPPACAGRSATWTGSELVVWGGVECGGEVFRYRPPGL